MSGTPPRWRGRLPSTKRARAGRGNTPALAGTTSRSRPPRPAPPEHPRVGGDDVVSGPRSIAIRGTPPRWRGRLRREHPRVGGDDYVPGQGDPWQLGTPPRWRGRHHQVVRPAVREGNTPALAGTTTGKPSIAIMRAEHPRVGGDDANSLRRSATTTGTPPRWRGRPRADVRAHILLRNTPALAGTTGPNPPGYPPR